MTTNALELDFETFLKSDDFAFFNTEIKRMTAISRTTGSLSTTASICMIVHILRSHHGLTTTYHRLVFGLAIGDIFFSFFGFVLGNIMAPKEYGYLASGAIGNQATCDAQGFLFNFGLGIGLSYNSSICIYYLAIVTFNKKDNYIRTKLEPWLHGISILIPLAFYSAVLAIKGYNSAGGFCWFGPNELPHCWGIESGEIRDGFTIPCDRGDSEVHRFLSILTMSSILLAPVVIVVTMTIMYGTVHKVEKKMQKYGIGALRIRKKATNCDVGNNTNGHASASNTSPPGSQPTPPDEDSGNTSRSSLLQWLKTNFRKIPCMDTCCSNERNKLRSNAISSQKRAILHRALGYVTAWGFSWIPFFILHHVIGILNAGVAMVYIQCFLTPLHGFFNFIVYMLPKVRNAKKGPTKRSRVKHGGPGNGNHINNITWRKAFLKAYMLRGPKKMSGRHHPRTTNSSNNGSCISNIMKVFKKLKISITTQLRTSITALSRSQPMNEDGVLNMNQLQEIRPPSPTSEQHNNDDELPAPALERNIYTSSPPLDLSKDAADDLKEEGKCAEDEGGSEELHLNNNNGIESMNNEDMGEVLDGVYLSEEIQSILE